MQNTNIGLQYPFKHLINNNNQQLYHHLYHHYQFKYNKNNNILNLPNKINVIFNNIEQTNLPVPFIYTNHLKIVNMSSNTKMLGLNLQPDNIEELNLLQNSNIYLEFFLYITGILPDIDKLNLTFGLYCPATKVPTTPKIPPDNLVKNYQIIIERIEQVLNQQQENNYNQEIINLDLINSYESNPYEYVYDLTTNTVLNLSYNIAIVTTRLIKNDLYRIKIRFLPYDEQPLGVMFIRFPDPEDIFTPN